MILGISGGIDSTLTAAICYEVIKRYPKDNLKFVGVNLPCSTNTEEENISALNTMKAFCQENNYWIQNLEKEYTLMKSTCELHSTSTIISQGNIKARLRMIYLYNLASTLNGIVIDTDNLTEYYLGFFTIHGDMGDYNPIGGLWKHEIYELAKYLLKYYLDDLNKKNAIKKSIEINPTDGNGIDDDGDMGQIAPGYTYNDVDDILISYIKYGDKGIEKSNRKYGIDTVNRIIKRMKNSEFKRKRLPIVIQRSLYDN
jgi:NAD+ synthetase